MVREGRRDEGSSGKGKVERKRVFVPSLEDGGGSSVTVPAFSGPRRAAPFRNVSVAAQSPGSKYFWWCGRLLPRPNWMMWKRWHRASTWSKASSKKNVDAEHVCVNCMSHECIPRCARDYTVHIHVTRQVSSSIQPASHGADGLLLKSRTTAKKRERGGVWKRPEQPTTNDQHTSTTADRPPPTPTTIRLVSARACVPYETFSVKTVVPTCPLDTDARNNPHMQKRVMNNLHVSCLSMTLIAKCNDQRERDPVHHPRLRAVVVVECED